MVLCNDPEPDLWLSRVAELDLLTSPVCNSEVMAAQRLVTLALMVSMSVVLSRPRHDN